MDVVAAYESVGTYRGAAEMCGVDPKTVKRKVLAHQAGALDPERARRAPVARNFDGVAALVTSEVDRTRAKISAKRLLPAARAAGYTGSPRNFRRLVAAGAKRVIAVDVTGLPLAARVTPASVTESETVGLLLGDMADAGQNDRLDVVLVDRGTGVRQAQRHSKTFGVQVRRVFHDPRPVDQFGRGLYVPLPFAWRVETAHGTLGRSRRLAKSFENTTASATAWLQVACIAAILVLSR